MKRFHSNVGAAQRSLEKRPEIFPAVDVALSASVSLSLVDYVMHKPPPHSAVICDRAVGVYRAPKLHVLENLILQSLAGHVRHHSSANLPQIAVEDALHNRLASRGSNKSLLRCKLRAAGTVHVLDLAANKGFIHFQLAAFAADPARIKGMLSHDFADTLKHEPCRRLGHAQSTAKFVRADSVLRIRQQPERCHPLVESKRRVFEDGLNFERKLPLACVAEPQFAG